MPTFPEGYDPNYFPGDSRTFAGAVAAAASAAASAQPSSATLNGPHSPQEAPGTSAAAEPSATALEALLPTFDFDTATDAEVDAIEQAVFKDVRREAAELSGSYLTSSLVRRCVLQPKTLSDALAVILSGKVHEVLPGALEYTAGGGSRAETATAEEAMRDTMARRFREPALRRAVVSDLIKVLVVDPAADGLLQPLLFFKGFHALATYRVANSLWRDGTPASKGAALLLQSRAAELFSVDIHPGATIGNGVMLDHATGIVVGSTATIGSDVYMLHGVTLGATGRPVAPGATRHPTVGSRCILGASATILGDIAIGDECTVGAAAIVTKPVPDGSTVVGVNNIVSKVKDVPPEKRATVDEYDWYYNL